MRVRRGKDRRAQRSKRRQSDTPDTSLEAVILGQPFQQPLLRQGSSPGQVSPYVSNHELPGPCLGVLKVLLTKAAGLIGYQREVTGEAGPAGGSLPEPPRPLCSRLCLFKDPQWSDFPGTYPVLSTSPAALQSWARIPVLPFTEDSDPGYLLCPGLCTGRWWGLLGGDVWITGGDLHKGLSTTPSSL